VCQQLVRWSNNNRNNNGDLKSCHVQTLYSLYCARFSIRCAPRAVSSVPWKREINLPPGTAGINRLWLLSRDYTRPVCTVRLHAVVAHFSYKLPIIILFSCYILQYNYRHWLFLTSQFKFYVKTRYAFIQIMISGIALFKL